MEYDFSYFKNLANKQYEEAFDDVRELLKETHNNPEWQQTLEKTNQFIMWCLDEYQKDGEIALYCFANEVFYSQNPIMFLEGLHSFVGNCIYDDSYFVVEYRDFPDEWYNSKNIQERIEKYEQNFVRQVNGIFNYNNKLHSHWQPILLWVGDENENATQNPDYLLSAIKFIEDQREHRILIAQEREKRFKELLGN